MPTLPPAVRVFERGWLSSNNILITGRDGATLVDTGYVTHAAQTLSLVRHALQERPLDRIVNTHLHSDHCGGNAALRDAYRCRIAIPRAECAKVDAWDEDVLSFRATAQQCPRFAYDEAIQPGQRLRMGDLDWQALAAPGHDPHALLLWCEAQGILISGDALWRNGFGVVFPELAGEPGFIDVRATLDLIATLDVRVVIPGHGAPFADVAAALDRAYSRLDYLAADPVRNAENAARVLLKFLLLERRRIPLADVETLCATVPLLVLARERFLHGSGEDLADRLVRALVKAGAARVEDATLVEP
ncbi:MBL fold metallo-hydrolase [Massilia luteola]|uniref:MBL fold metallo-hydrolase n=1 Tax=Massilia luteola TaxID=3081751 RepID=UPI002ACC050B|nr:MBL fold metallo-hydrolase [Massilia sp. Gc5]